jgi:hypothetical protein
LIVLVAAVGCGPKVHMDDSPFEMDDPAAGTAIDGPKAPPAWDTLPEAPPPTTPVSRTGTIDRGALDAILDAGPGPILSHVEVSAVTEGDTFYGWRIVQFDPKHRDFDGVDLQPGDVLVSVNGILLSKPDDLNHLWDELRTADAIVADVTRDGTRIELTWSVTAAAAATPADHS